MTKEENKINYVNLPADDCAIDVIETVMMYLVDCKILFCKGEDELSDNEVKDYII